MKLKNKTIILTGAARIGKSVAQILGSKGANLVVTYLNSKHEAKFICEECQVAGSKVIAVKTDLSQSSEIKNLIKATKNEFGKIDGLIHMAAIYEKTPWQDLTETVWDKNLNIIAKSAFLLGKLVGDELLKNPGEIKGKIITITDWSVLNQPYKDYLPYNVAKTAVIGLTKSLAKELAPHILVNSIAPGPILKPNNLTEAENREVLKNTPLARWGGAEEIAKAVLYLLEADFVTGQILYVDGGRSIA